MGQSKKAEATSLVREVELRIYNGELQLAKSLLEAAYVLIDRVYPAKWAVDLLTQAAYYRARLKAMGVEVSRPTPKQGWKDSRQGRKMNPSPTSKKMTVDLIRRLPALVLVGVPASQQARLRDEVTAILGSDLPRLRVVVDGARGHSAPEIAEAIRKAVHQVHQVHQVHRGNPHGTHDPYTSPPWTEKQLLDYLREHAPRNGITVKEMVFGFGGYSQAHEKKLNSMVKRGLLARQRWARGGDHYVLPDAKANP